MTKQFTKQDVDDLPFLKLAAGFLLLVLTSTIITGDLQLGERSVVKQPEVYVSQMGNRIKAIKYLCPKDSHVDRLSVSFPGVKDILLLGENYNFSAFGLTDYDSNNFSQCSQAGAIGYMESPESTGGNDLIPLYVRTTGRVKNNCTELGGSVNACDPRNRNDCYTGSKAFMDTDTSSANGKKIGYIHKPNNVAEGKTVQVSSGTGAGNLVDGNHQKSSSQWVSEYEATHWIEIDLGEEKEIEMVQLYMGNGSDYSSTLSSFSISRCTQQDTEDGLCDPDNHSNGWRTIVTKNNNQEGIVRLSFTPVTARKVYLYSNAPVSQAKLYEMEVIGTPEEGLTPLYRTSKVNGWTDCVFVPRPDLIHISTYGLTTDPNNLAGYENPILLGYLEKEGYTPGEPTPTSVPTTEPTSVPTTEPTPTTVGPTPTATPTVVPTPGDNEVEIQVKFKGVNSRPANDASQTIKVWGETLDRSVALATKASPLSVTMTVNDQGVYSGKLTLTDSQINQHYRLVLKGPRHLGREFVDIVLGEGGVVVLLGPGQELLPGDLNQDGVVNSADVAIVNDNTSASPNSAGDLNYDNYTAAADKMLILETLSVRQDPQ